MKVLVYLKTGCPWASAVTNFLDEHSIAFEERDILLNREFAREVVEKSGQSKSPTLDIDGAILADVGIDDVERHLESVGCRI